jgi:hypothetical protein
MNTERGSGFTARRITRFREFALLPMALAVIFLALGPGALPAYALGISGIVLTGDTPSATIQEGLSFIVTYSAAVTVTDPNPNNFYGGAETFTLTAILLSGDPTDSNSVLNNFSFFSPVADSCKSGFFSSAGNGTSANTCTVQLKYESLDPNAATETDRDSSFTRIDLSFGLFPATTNAVTTFFTVTDVGFVRAVPEPSSLLLLGLGALGLGWRLRRRR